MPTIKSKFYSKFDRVYNRSFRTFPSEENSFNRIKFPYTFGIELESVIPMKDMIRATKKADPELFKHSTIHQDVSVRPSRSRDRTGEITTDILCGDRGIEYVERLIKEFNLKFNRSCGQHVHVCPNIGSTTFFSAQRKNAFLAKLGLFMSIADIAYFKDKTPETRLLVYRYSGYLIAVSRSFVSGFLGPDGKEDFKSTIDYGSTFCHLLNSKDRTVNFNASYGTVEFRIMQGTSDIRRITNMINHYMQIVDICNHTDPEILRQWLVDAMAKSNVTVADLYAFEQKIASNPRDCKTPENIRNLGRRIGSLLATGFPKKKALAPSSVKFDYINPTYVHRYALNSGYDASRNGASYVAQHHVTTPSEGIARDLAYIMARVRQL